MVNRPHNMTSCLAIRPLEQFTLWGTTAFEERIGSLSMRNWRSSAGRLKSAVAKPRGPKSHYPSFSVEVF